MNDTRGSTRTLLTDEITELLEADDASETDAQYVVLAALEGADELADMLDNSAPVPTTETEAPAETDTEDSPEPSGAFIESVTVSGFRGIGPQATLPLYPAPGLTIVAGRNGSGKSSFSEAIEVALTGNTYRWNKQNGRKAAVWQQHWRNLHQAEPCEVRIGLAVEGQGAATVGVTWAAGTGDLADRKSWFQRAGQRQEEGLDSLGWDRDIERYQPILSYDELGGLLESEPSKLHDKINEVLGLEQATDTEQLLTDVVKRLGEAEEARKACTRELKKQLDGVDDERAHAALAQLRKHRPDVDEVERIATGAAPQRGIDGLRTLAEVTIPADDVVAEAVGELRGAAGAWAELADQAATLADRRTTLLRNALDVHAHEGDIECPVCGEGTLDDAWRQQVEDALEAERAESQQRRATGDRLERARRRLADVVDGVLIPATPEQFSLSTRAAADEAVRRWKDLPDNDVERASHVERVHPELAEAVASLRDETRQLLAEHEDAWASHALDLGEWVKLARDAAAQQPRLERAKAGRDAMRRVREQLRNNRLAALEERAREIWAALKQESNVELGGIRFKGRATRRQLELYADVDGADAEALGVMSQGELHGLALALFLPRATAPASPFRFVVLDDPIQAMDPAKVDSFVKVLAGFARDRQVVVFSHDDRLPQAVRQLGVDARIVEVNRDSESAVTVANCEDPARRLLDDAFAICKDQQVPDEVRRRVLPGLCRQAVEAACHELYLNRRLTRGDARTDVEDGWRSVERTKNRIALVVEGDPEADISGWKRRGPGRSEAFGLVTGGAHGQLDRDPLDAVRSVENLVKDLRSTR
ncbi:ATP-binding protein [Prauserella halophila]|uniref:Nuclease SbcCD subunit C n=1 Tax=Prauserella halophila TaxID=185641 RepID=A0ABN1W354_9PSEU|nr:AAA family ATPase [Prauserella halophila]MCP2236238.1 RecF/RecN/SMC N terminal domain-containing protein [Prauserella halophila]